MPPIPVQPGVLITFNERNFPYKQGKLEKIAREYLQEIGVKEPRQEFYLGVEDVQCDFGIFRKVLGEKGTMRIDYQKSFPWCSVSEGIPDPSARGDRKYISELLMEFNSDPEGTVPKLKEAFVNGPTIETLTQRIDNGKGQDFDATIIRTVSMPVAHQGLQSFRVQLLVPTADVNAYRECIKSKNHPYKRFTAYQLPHHLRADPRMCRLVEGSVPSLGDVRDLFSMNEEFYRINR